MLVKMLTSIAGHNWSAVPGDTIELNPGDAKRLIKAGLAERVKPEAAVTGASENAMRPQARKGVKNG